MDTIPDFKMHLFDYSGSWHSIRHPSDKQASRSPTDWVGDQNWKNEIPQYHSQHLGPSRKQPSKATQQQRTKDASLDDNILIRHSDLNTTLHLGRQLNRITFSLSLSKDSYCKRKKMPT